MKGSDFDRIQQRLQDHPTIPGNNNEDEWICVHYRGLPGRMHFAIGVVSVLAVLLFALGILPLVLCLLAGRAIMGGGRKNSSTILRTTTRPKKGDWAYSRVV